MNTGIETIEHDGQQFVIPSALAAAHHVTAHAVRKAITDQTLEGRKVLGRWLIPVAAAAAYVPGQRGGAKPGAGRPRLRGEIQNRRED